MGQKHIFIICGEPSGDLHAANLAKEILKIDPQVKISGVGGQLLREAGARLYCDISELAVIGLFDVLKKLPRFFSLKKMILEKIRLERPTAIILVDFSGFNLRLAKAINKQIKVIYYVSPQLWASRPGRIGSIKNSVDKMIVFFRFEEKLYREHSVDVSFVGHPLLDIVGPTMDKDRFLRNYGLALGKTTIALLPGSRKQEIRNILPVMLKSARIIKDSLGNTQFLIAKPVHLENDIFLDCIRDAGIEAKIIEDKTYDCLSVSDFALVASGTATLETAIIGIPFFIIYKMNLLNYLLYRPQVRIPFIGIVNIIAQKKIVPEYIQFNADPREIARAAIRLLSDREAAEEIRRQLSLVKGSLGEKGAGNRAAKIVLDYLRFSKR
ncbi:MAG: lipid-A-disaccharide synthase [Candidatus Omnitrophica bacterium]|nr:lipid-A-disaccharide synthase [Candidatus Omnitrophota bacterium]